MYTNLQYFGFIKEQHRKLATEVLSRMSLTSFVRGWNLLFYIYGHLNFESILK